MTGFSVLTGTESTRSTSTNLTYCEYYESVTSNDDYKPEVVIKEKDYIKVIENLKLKPLPEHRQPVLRRKTMRSLVAPVPNKGWKQRR